MSEEIKATTAELNADTKDTILFESLVGNEREYLTKTLKAQMLEKPNDFACSCGSFARWLSTQFRRITIPQISSTLIYNLDFLKKNCTLADLFTKEGDNAKKAKYFESIAQCLPINYEEGDMDIYALASASKEYITTEVSFFDEDLTNKMNEVYRNKDEDKKKMFMERLPFMMDNRSLFKVIKELCEEFEKKSSLTKNDTIKIWVDAVLPDTIEVEFRDSIMKDTFLVSLDKVPLSFYNNPNKP